MPEATGTVTNLRRGPALAAASLTAAVAAGRLGRVLAIAEFLVALAEPTLGTEYFLPFGGIPFVEVGNDVNGGTNGV